MTRVSRSLLVLTAVTVIGVSAYLLLTQRSLRVPVATAEQSVAVRVYGLGTVEARIVSKVGFEAGAALSELAVDTGDVVVRGQTLARLHSDVQEARVARARAALLAAEASLSKAQASVQRGLAVLAQREATNARQKALVARGTISTQTAEEAQRDVDVGRADVSLAESDVGVARAQVADATAALAYETRVLEQHVLYAPFDAVIVNRHAEAGTVVRAGDVIFTLMDPATVWILAYVDEGRAGALVLGQLSEIRLRSLPQASFTGRVMRIGIESDRVNEERRVWISCEACPPRAFLGEQAEVRITVATLGTAILVPETAVRGFDGHHGRAWIAQDGKASEVQLSFGHPTEDGRLEVVGGLPEGAQVITAPAKSLAEGRAVKVVAEAAP